MINKHIVLEKQLDYFIKENERLRVENTRLEFENIGLREIIESTSETRIDMIKMINKTLKEAHPNVR